MNDDNLRANHPNLLLGEDGSRRLHGFAGDEKSRGESDPEAVRRLSERHAATLDLLAE